LNEPGLTEEYIHFKEYNNIIEYQNYNTAILRVLNKGLLPNSSWWAIIKNHFNEDNLQKEILQKIKENSKDTNKEGNIMKCKIYTMEEKLNYTDLYVNMSNSFKNLNK